MTLNPEQSTRLLMVMFHAKGCDGNHRSPRLAQVNLTYTTVTRVNEYLEGNSDQFDFQGCTRILMYAATMVDKYVRGDTDDSRTFLCPYPVPRRQYLCPSISDRPLHVFFVMVREAGT